MDRINVLTLTPLQLKRNSVVFFDRESGLYFHAARRVTNQIFQSLTHNKEVTDFYFEQEEFRGEVYNWIYSPHKL